MSSKKFAPIEIKKEDLSTITNLRNLLITFLNCENDAKKAAQVLKLWLQEKK